MNNQQIRFVTKAETLYETNTRFYKGTSELVTKDMGLSHLKSSMTSQALQQPQNSY